jgi:hypothetical protein
MVTEENISLENQKDEKYLLNGFAIILVVIGLIVMITFYIKMGQHFSIASEKDKISMDVNGQIGDFIGGVVGTLFSLVGVLLLFITLKDQRESFKKERFEQRLFELIKLHSQNVSEFEIAGTVKGRSCFKFMINELRLIYRFVEIGALKENIVNDSPEVASPRDYLKMSYLIMFFGIGYTSERQLHELFNKEESRIFDDFVKEKLMEVQAQYESEIGANSSINFSYKIPLVGIPDGFTFETRFYPFDGHASRLGHYFRLLFQIVKYVDKQPITIIDNDEKYEYVKNLRATLSNQEQLLFYYNSMSKFGVDWIHEGLIKKYALIKNVPLGIIDIGIHPHDIFGILNDDGKYLFETDEILARNKI